MNEREFLLLRDLAIMQKCIGFHYSEDALDKLSDFLYHSDDTSALDKALTQVEQILKNDSSEQQFLRELKKSMT